MANVAIKSGTQLPEMESPNLNMGTFIINPADDRAYYIEWTTISEMLGVDLSSAAYAGVALTTTVPIAVGFIRYLVSAPGTYTNFKDLGNASIIVTPEDLVAGYVELWGTNNVFQKHLVPLPDSNIYAKLGYTPNITYERQKPNTELADMASIQGGPGVKIFNNFDTSTVRKYVKITLRTPSASANSVIIAKLASDGVTVTEIETHIFPTGTSEFTFTNPIVCQVGEKIGVIPSIGFSAAATGDIGSRYYNPGTGNWSAQVITWGYALTIEIPPQTITYDTLKKVSDAIVATQNDLENYATSADIDNVSSKLDSILIQGSDNIADKSKIIAGSNFGFTTGVIVANAAYRRLLIPIIEGNTYTIFGVSTTFIGNVYNASALESDNSTFNSSSRILALGDNTTLKTVYTFLAPAGAKWLGLNVNSSSSSAFDNTVMVYKEPGTTQSSPLPPYVAYTGIGVNGGKVMGTIPNVVYNSTFLPVSNQVTQNTSDISKVLTDSYTTYFEFNGTTSKAELTTELFINEVGDYVEYVARRKGTTTNQSQGLIGSLRETGTKNALGYASDGRIMLRGNSTTDAYIYATSPAPVSDFRKIRVEIIDVSGVKNWRFFVDDSAILTTPVLSGLYVKNVGNGYRPGNVANELFKGDIGYIKIKSGATELNITDLTTLPNAVGINKILQKKEAAAAYPLAFYSFALTGGAQSQGRFAVYMQYREKVNYYARFDIDHEVNVPLRQNLWRIAGSQQCTYDPSTNVMTQTGKQLLHTAETEYVVRFPLDDDSVGGFHGNEMADSITFLVNGVPVSISANIALTACTGVEYLQTSVMYKKTETAVNNAILRHVKRTTFKNAGFKTYNTLRVLAYPESASNLLFNSIYSGLFTVGIASSDFFFSDEGVITPALHATSAATYLLNEAHNRSITYYQPTNKMGAKATSHFTYVTVSGTNSTNTFNDTLTVLQAWDRSTDTKYYRRIQGATSVFFIGDRIEAEGEMSFMML